MEHVEGIWQYMYWWGCQNKHLYRFQLYTVQIPMIEDTYICIYMGPCNLRPLRLTNPSILRPSTSDQSLILSI